MDSKGSGAGDNDDCEPGACQESSLITTDSFEEFNQEMNLNLNNVAAPKSPETTASTETLDFEIEKELTETLEEKLVTRDVSEQSSIQTVGDEGVSIDEDFDYAQDQEWLKKRKHIFILSTAGKPIYSLYGNEDKLASMFGVMQALVSVVQANEDTIKAIHAGGVKFVFLVKSSLILVAVSRSQLSVPQIQMQLTDVYNQIISTLTLAYMEKIYEKRKNFDLRRLLGGSERLISHLLLNNGQAEPGQCVSNNPFTFLTHSVRILPISQSVRDTITTAIQNSCSKINNLVFAVLIAKNKLISLVRNKKCFVHPADLRLIFSLIECTESFKESESWTPICLPKFNPNGYLHAHVSYLSSECEACLLIFTVDREQFYVLSDAKQKITEKLRKSNCMEAINDAIRDKGLNLRKMGLPEIRHFIYKCKYNAQLLCSEITVPYNTPEQFSRLEAMYYKVHHRIHNLSRPLKLIYEMREREIVFAWTTAGYELYATFEPLIDKMTVITLVNKMLKWIKKEENVLFIMNSPTF